MVKINGRTQGQRAELCPVCGARWRQDAKGEEYCPNGERNDHLGRPYAAGANLAAGEG